jgi:CRP-like cAMP-binding protein
MTNMTKVQKFTAIAKALEGVTLDGFDAQAFLASEIALVNKRNARKSNTPTKTQKENEAVKANILSTLEGAVEIGMTATEVGKVLGLTPQKVSALMKQLIADGNVEKTKVGKSTLFFLV